MLTVLQLGEGAENRSRNFQFSTDLSKTAWCCELTIFLAKTKRFLRQSKPKFSTYTELRSFAKLPVICSAFCSVGLEICRSSGGKFILFWRWGKEGREKLFCRHGFWCWWSGMQMCFYRCGGLYCSICKQTWKNLKQHRNNWTPQCFNIKLHHKNITPHRKNIKSQRYNITPHRANIKPQDKNIELHR